MVFHKLTYFADTNSLEASWVDDAGVQVKCHSYSDRQIDNLKADVGPDAVAANAEVIAYVQNNIKPVAPVADTPITVTPWQFRKALNQTGLRSDVDALLASSQDRTLKDGWEVATIYIENDPFIITLGAAMNKTADDIHNLFALAQTL